LGFLKGDILSFTRVLHEIKFVEQFLKMTTKGTFLWSFGEIGSAVYEELSYKMNVYGSGTEDAGRKEITKAHHVTLWYVS
jgi:hypothetical protein